MTLPATIGCILLGLVGLILLIPLVPLFVRLTFCEDLFVTVYVWGIPVFRFSSKEDTNEVKTAPLADKPLKEKKETVFSSLSHRLKQDGVAATLQYVRGLAEVATGALKRLLAALTVDRLVLRLFVASDDAADTALTTGKLCAVLYPALTAIQSVLRIRKRDVTVTPDFLAGKGRVTADVLVHAIPYRLLWVGFHTWRVYKKKSTINHTIEEENVNG